MKIWTGIGSRKTPERFRPVFTEIASMFAAAGWACRSGGADGPDTWCELATPIGQREIYLPWAGFNGNPSPRCGASVEALALAESVHPAWHRCSDSVRRLHGRNVYQVLGQDLATLTRVIVCWTLDGENLGGTATALELAEEREIEVLNLGATWGSFLTIREHVFARVSRIIDEAA